MKKENIETQAINSFRDLPHPEAGNIVIDDSGDHLECNQVKENFLPYSWQALPLEIMKNNDSALSFLTPEAFRYYLPAYLVASLNYFEELDTIPLNIVHYLTLPVEVDPILKLEFLRNKEGPGLSELLQRELEQTDLRVHRFFERMAGFSVQQSATIKNFLAYLHEHHHTYFDLGEPGTAINRYWFIF